MFNSNSFTFVSGHQQGRSKHWKEVNIGMNYLNLDQKIKKKNNQIIKCLKSQTQEALDRIQHTCKEPFNCSNCNKNFMQESDLKQHETSHSCEKPFNC